MVPIPGASAVLAALTASGLPSDAFLFAGFLPVKDGQRRSRLEALKATPATLIFFESPRRLSDTLAAMADVLGDRPAAIGRELTKTFEEMRTGSLGALAAHYGEAPTPKGEIVICVAPPEHQPDQPGDVDRLLRSLAVRDAGIEGRRRGGAHDRAAETGTLPAVAGASRRGWRLTGEHGRRPTGAAIRANGWPRRPCLLKGYRILARRYRTRLGEIDLIARRGDLVLIVEVKARRTLCRCDGGDCA